MTTTQAPLRAYFGDPALKAEVVSRMEAHIASDELVKAANGQDGRGCAVWCTYDEYDHALGPARLGVPLWYEEVRDDIFEGLPIEEAKAWALASFVCVPVGADVDSIRIPFMKRVMRRRLDALPDREDRVRAAVTGVLEWLDAGADDEARRRHVCDEAQKAGNAALTEQGSETAEAAVWAAYRLSMWADPDFPFRMVMEHASSAATYAEESGRALRFDEDRAQRDDLIDLLRGLEAA